MAETQVRLAIDILRASNDGNDLDPVALHLVEVAANGRLNEKGVQLLTTMCEKLRQGTWRPFWLHGIPQLSAKADGTVLWRMRHPVATLPNPLDPEHSGYLLTLAERCRHLEALGLAPSVARVGYYWHRYARLTRDNPYFDLIVTDFRSFEVRNDGAWRLVIPARDGNFKIEGQTVAAARAAADLPAGDYRTHPALEAPEHDAHTIAAVFRAYGVPRALPDAMAMTSRLALALQVPRGRA